MGSTDTLPESCVSQTQKMHDVTLANCLMRVSRGFHVTGTLPESCVSQKQKIQDVTLAYLFMRVSRGFHVTRTLLESCVSERHTIQGVTPFSRIVSAFGGASEQHGAVWGAMMRLEAD